MCVTEFEYTFQGPHGLVLHVWDDSWWDEKFLSKVQLLHSYCVALVGPSNVCWQAVPELSSRPFQVFSNCFATICNQLYHNNPSQTWTTIMMGNNTCWGLQFRRRWGTSWRWGWWRRQRCRRPDGSWLQIGLWSPVLGFSETMTKDLLKAALKTASRAIGQLWFQ